MKKLDICTLISFYIYPHQIFFFLYQEAQLNITEIITYPLAKKMKILDRKSVFHVDLYACDVFTLMPIS